MSRPALLKTQMARALTALALLIATILPHGALAESPAGGLTEAATVALPDAQRRDLVGISVAASDDLVVVGAPGADRVSDGAGLVMLLQREGEQWRHGAVITDEMVGVAAGFGGAVATDGGSVLVGAPRDLADHGAAYLYEPGGDGWTRTARFELPDSAAFDFFGAAVAIHGDTALVGAPGYDGAMEDGGAAVIYLRSGDGWQEHARLQPSELAPGSRLGAAVALSGDLAVVGAPNEGAGGVAYLFVRTGDDWTQAARLEPGDGAEEAAFGEAVATDGYTVAIGARFETAEHDEQGAAYLFELRDGAWRLAAHLTATDAGRRDSFGFSVAVEDDLALVGAPRHDADGDDAGAVFAFQREGNSWTPAGRLARSAPDVYDEFGSSVALNAGAAFVGAPYDVLDGAEHDTGSVTVYR